MEYTKRFSIFGIALLWASLIPLYMVFVSNSAALGMLGTLLLVGWFILFSRAEDMDLKLVTVKKISSAWESSSLAILGLTAAGWVLWHGQDGKAILWAWGLICVTMTLRMMIEMNTPPIGEQA